MTDSSASTVWSTTYQPYGLTGTITGSLTQDIRLPGQVDDPEIGLYQNGFRDYGPHFGRYLEADPIGLGGGMNPYLYARANPLKFTDAAGTNPDDYTPVPDLTSGFNDFAEHVNDIFGGDGSLGGPIDLTSGFASFGQLTNEIFGSDSPSQLTQAFRDFLNPALPPNPSALQRANSIIAPALLSNLLSGGSSLGPSTPVDLSTGIRVIFTLGADAIAANVYNSVLPNGGQSADAAFDSGLSGMILSHAFGVSPIHPMAPPRISEQQYQNMVGQPVSSSPSASSILLY